jgi:site-specific recombinase XerD
VRIGAAVKSFLSGYFSTCKRSGKTAAAYRADLSQFAGRFGNGTVLSSLKSEEFEDWATELRKRNYAPASVRRKFATVRVFLSYWVRKGVIGTSPLRTIRLDLGPGRFLPRAISPTDAKRLIEAAWRRIDFNAEDIHSTRSAHFLAIRDLAAMEILFATGIRVGELVTLNCRDWREDDSAFFVKGKGLRERLAILPDQRSRAALDIYLQQRNRMDLAHDSLLVNASGEPISTQGIARSVSAIAELSEIRRHVTPHMIRHTVATLLLRCGADIRIVQEVLGHASISTTQRYTHISKEHLLTVLRSQHPNFHINFELPRASDASQLAFPFRSRG